MRLPRGTAQGGKWPAIGRKKEEKGEKEIRDLDKSVEEAEVVSGLFDVWGGP